MGVIALLWELKHHVPGNHGLTRTWLSSLTAVGLAIALLVAAVTGALIFLKIPGLDAVTRYAYTGFDVAVAFILLGAIVSVLRQARRLTFCPTGQGATLAPRAAE